MKPAIQILALGCTLLLPGTQAFSQKICQQTAVYFESGKSTLTASATRRLDSLIAIWGANEVHLELEGHTDSINGTDVNQSLSENRIATVKAYLEGRSKAALTTTVFAVGEQDPAADNGTDLGKAQNRRVELKYMLLKDGNFTFTGQRGASMTMSPNDIRECSLCNTDFSLTYLANDQAVAAAGIPMMTVDGRRLTTGGMLDPSISCTSDGKNEKHVCEHIRATFSFPIQTTDSAYSAWASNPNGLWAPYSQFERNGNWVTMTFDDYCWCRHPNWDCHGYLYDSVHITMVTDISNLKILKRKITYQPSAKTKPLTVLANKAYQRDTIISSQYKSLAVNGDGQLFFCNMPVRMVKDTLFERIGQHITKIFQVGFGHYQAINFSDTLEVIKVKRRLKVSSVGFYLKDADITLSFQPIGKRKFQSPILLFQHELSFQTEGGRQFRKSPDRIEFKYRPRRHYYLGKLKKR